MWCPRCRQDVPAIAAVGERSLCCVRCRQPIAKLGEQSHPSEPQSVSPDPIVAEAPAGATVDPLETDELNLLVTQQAELDDLLARAEWLLGIEHSAPKAATGARYVAGMHSAHDHSGGPHFARQRQQERTPRVSRITVISWCALAVAMTGFVCGGILLGWSLIFNRPELWNVGETVTLASQVGLLVGLILQLDRLGHDRHQTVNRLTILDERVESLRSNSEFLAESRQLRSDGQHGEEITLADLKNQLDVLVNRLSDKRSA